MSGIFSSAAYNCRMGWKSCISAALGRVTVEDWSLGFTSFARGALEEHVMHAGEMFCFTTWSFCRCLTRIHKRHSLLPLQEQD